MKVGVVNSITEMSSVEAPSRRFIWLPPIFRALKYLLRYIPPRVSLAIARTGGYLVGLLCTRENKVADLQLAFASSGESEAAQLLGKQDLSKIRRRMYGHLVESYTETILAERLFEVLPGKSIHGAWFPNYKYLSFECDEGFRFSRDRGDSIVTLTAHLGCFELLAPFYERMGVGVSVFRRLSNYPEVNRVQESFLAWTGSEVIWRDDPKSVRKILRCLKSKNRTLAGLMDQDIDLENEFSTFFGLEAAAPIAAIKLGVKLGTPVFTAFIHRTKPMHHTVVTQQVEYDSQDPNVEQKILDEYHRRLESWIAKYPEQWVWLHRRWRRRPEVDYTKTPEALRSTQSYLAWLTNLLQERRASVTV